MYYKIKTSKLPMITWNGRVNLQSPFKHEERILGEYIIYIINSGELFLEEDGQRYHLQKGDYIMLDPYKKHKGYKLSTCDYYYIHFKSDIIENLNISEERFKTKINNNYTPNFYANDEPEQFSIYLPKHYSIKDMNDYYSITHHIDEAINAHHDGIAFYPVLGSTKLVDIFIKIYQMLLRDYNYNVNHQASKSLLTVQHVRKYIERNIFRTIKRKEIMDMIHLNYDYLNRLFKKQIGCSINKYIQLKKIETAKNIMLNNHDLKISEIGYLVGIDNPFYFSKLFKKIVGESPQQYYKKVLANTDYSNERE
ncbi:AraC family transcriptional regulator [Haloplasma contractile]|uniref:Transcriptional regulator AraC family protein n=1 Tax=Haloplasma contractile SSD-17B TaxID=1033810 RepID=F7Q129_9MOLU|nr:AraC family transcriptional regulator [Haloplasma contractile]ERJ11329.1 Transcriptional regulator AraC family protein [Haloplasma contractile SSD-17B]